MPIIAITGGIASGKSCFAGMLRRKLQVALGGGEPPVELFDADAVSRELTGENGGAMPSIVRRFGTGILEVPTAGSAETGSPPLRLNRPLVRELAFADPPFRRALEAILHPLILGRWTERIAAKAAPLADPAAPAFSSSLVISSVASPAASTGSANPPPKKSPEKTWFLGDIPLLFETKCAKTWDLAIVVAAPEETRLARLRGERGLDEPLARRILATQAAQMCPAAKVARADVVVWNAAPLARLEEQAELLARTLLNRFAD